LITVKLRNILTIKQILRRGEIDHPMPEGSTLNDLFTSLVANWGNKLRSEIMDSDDSLHSYIRLMMNGRYIAFFDQYSFNMEMRS